MVRLNAGIRRRWLASMIRRAWRGTTTFALCAVQRAMAHLKATCALSANRYKSKSKKAADASMRLAAFSGKLS